MDVHHSEQLMQLLITAINCGDVQAAQDIAVSLANQRAKLEIDIAQDSNELAKDKPFKITVQVEDRESAGVSFELLVRLTDRIGDLKKKVKINFKFPEEVQRWIIGKRILDNSTTLSKAGVIPPESGVQSPTAIFLYLLPAHSIGLTERPDDSGGYVDDYLDTKADPFEKRLSLDMGRSPNNMTRPLSNHSINSAAYESSYESAEEEEGAAEDIADWKCPFCTVINNTNTPVCETCHLDRLAPRPVLSNNVDLNCGDRVIWYNDKLPQRGTVRWVGILPDVEGDKLTVGVEFDNPVGVGDGGYKNERLFQAKDKHAALVPIDGLIKDQ